MTTQLTFKVTAMAVFSAVILAASYAYAQDAASTGPGRSVQSSDGNVSDAGSSATRTDGSGGTAGGYDGPGDTTPPSGNGESAVRPFDPGSAGYYRKAPHLIEGGNEALSNSQR